MGIVGRWIDTLNAEERDAIIQHRDPTYDGGWWWDSDRDCGCLVGCVVDVSPERAHLPHHAAWRGIPRLAGAQTEDHRVGYRFPCLTRRFTPERMWRLVKARAARPHRITLPEPSTARAVEVAGD